MIIFGCDPGLAGAIAIYRPFDQTVQTVEMPTLKLKAGSNKRIIDDYRLAQIVDALCRDGAPTLAVIEAVGPRPTDGSVQSFQFGAGFGVLRGVIAANFIPTHFVTPQSWKKRMGIPAGSDKDMSRALASRLFPRSAGLWGLKRQDGHAEAALLAKFGEQFVLNVAAAA